jgi:hypothetical protein
MPMNTPFDPFDSDFRRAFEMCYGSHDGVYQYIQEATGRSRFRNMTVNATARFKNALWTETTGPTRDSVRRALLDIV